jgi:hypothetical protein
MGKGWVVIPLEARRIVSKGWVVAASVARYICVLRPGVVKNEQGFSHFSRRVRRVRKLAEPTRIRLGSWNVGSLIGKLRELVDVAIRRRVNILCVQETKWKS